MKTAKSLLPAVVFLTLGRVGYCGTVDRPYEVGTWPGFRSAAISYTFDDGCSNQLALAIPMFNEFGFKLTLFTITSWSPDWTALQDAASKGHEVASHTVTHPSLSGMTIEEQTAELKNSQDDINAHITGPKCVTLAYPYCAVGNGFVCEQYYIAARGCQGFIEAGTPGDFMNISSLICGELGSVKTAADFNGRFDSVAASKGWCVFLIHGIDNDGGYSPLPSDALRAGLQYLDARRSTFWVSTFGNVVRYVRERNAVSVKELASDETHIAVLATDSLDDAIYNDPVTLRRPLPSGWPSARVVQNGRVIGTQMMTEARGTKCIVFDVVPDGGVVVLSKALTAPTGLTAGAGDAMVVLDWNDNSESNLAGYNVYRSTASGSGYSRLNDSLVAHSDYSDANVAPNTTYYYVVTSVDANSNESGYSNEVSGGVHGDSAGNGTVGMRVGTRSGLETSPGATPTRSPSQEGCAIGGTSPWNEGWRDERGHLSPALRPARLFS